MFTNTTAFANAISIINGVENKKMQSFLSKLIQKQVEKQEVFGLSKVDSYLLFDCCAYVFEQALYNSIETDALIKQLDDAGINKSREFGVVWNEFGKTFTNKAKENSLGYDTLKDVTYRLGIKMSQDSLSKQKQPTCLFEFMFDSKTLIT
jgi:hypothetical protein